MMSKRSNQPSMDAICFVEEAANCKAQVKEVAQSIVQFAGNSPTEDEVLSRCRLVFEYILHEAMANTEIDDWDCEVEIHNEEI